MFTVESSLVSEPVRESHVFAGNVAPVLADPFPYKRALIALCIGTMTLMPAVYATQPILPLLSEAFHISAGTAGLTLAVFNLALAASVLIAGPFSDRLGRRPIILGVSLLLVIPTFLAALAPTYTLLLVARAAQGVLASGVGAIGVAYIGDEFPAARRGNAIGWYATALSSSALVGRVGGGIVAGLWGWRAMFFALAALSIFGALTLAIALPRASRFRPSANVGRAFRAMVATLREPALLGGYMLGFILGICLLGFFTYISYYLAAPPFNLSTTALGLIFVLYLLGLVNPVAGTISTRIGRRPVIALALVVMVIGLALTLSHSLTIVIIGIAIVILGLLTAYAMTNALVSDLAAGRRGSAAALYLSHWYAGGALGAWAFGPIWAHGGWGEVVAGTLAITLLAGLILWVTRGRRA